MGLPDPTTTRHAVVASVAGGVLFGLIMTTLGMMGTVAGLVGSESLAAAWAVHLAIAAIFGLPFAMLLANLRLHAVATGVLWGVLAWVGGALVLMPLMLGTPGMVLRLDLSTVWWSLLGHFEYGLGAGIVVNALPRSVPDRSKAVVQ